MPDPRDLPDPEHTVPDAVTDATVEALGALSEALETTERIRGHLYSLHQLTGTADYQLEAAAAKFRLAGHHDIAERIETELVGRNVLAGRWTFQVVEDYDDNYWTLLRRVEHDARQELVGGRRHLYEARLKQERRTHGLLGHEPTPGSVE